LVKLGEILYERNDLIAATEHVSAGVDLMQGWQQPFEMVRGYTTLATLLQAQNDAEGAREALHKAERIQSQHPSYPRLNSLVHSCRTRLSLAQDGPEQAARQAMETQLGESLAPIVREQEQMVLARVLVAGQRCDEALSLLDRRAAEAEAGGRFGHLVEILALQALARQAQGDTAQALGALEQALAMGAPEGYARVFVEGGRPMANLLRQAAARGIEPESVSRLLAALDAGEAARTPVLPPSGTPSLVEPLTARELEILELMGQGSSNRQIAAALVITRNTVKKHASNLYGKLGVHNRTQAVIRAQELDLL
jgi:LuxR family maltose regulon positive regulatory protein